MFKAATAGSRHVLLKRAAGSHRSPALTKVWIATVCSHRPRNFLSGACGASSLTAVPITRLASETPREGATPSHSLSVGGPSVSLIAATAAMPVVAASRPSNQGTCAVASAMPSTPKAHTSAASCTGSPSNTSGALTYFVVIVRSQVQSPVRLQNTAPMSHTMDVSPGPINMFFMERSPWTRSSVCKCWTPMVP